MKYKVLHIKKDETNEDTKNHPELINYLDGSDEDIFILDENGDVYCATDFFYMTNINIKEFEDISKI